MHTRLAIVGAGAGGHTLSAQLVRSGLFAAHDITIFDKKQDHHYQPSYTMVGGGVIGNATQAKKKESYYVVRPQADMFKSGANWVQKNVQDFTPEENSITLQDGDKCTYDYMVVAPGLELRWDQVPGAKEAMDHPDQPVASIYELAGAYKMSMLRESFRGGKAIFNLPTMPIKCGGAPQKIMYLAEETFRKNGVRDQTDMQWYTSVGNMFPNCPKHADYLDPMAREKGIDINYFQTIVGVDGENRKASFKDAQGEVNQVDFDLLHVVPPQSAPKFIRESPLAAANGWLDVNQQTLQHNKYSNIFGLGDVCNCPTAKTAAGVYTQAPIVAHNMAVTMGKEDSPPQIYTGYQACPVFTGDGKLMMIEFKYGNIEDESLYADQRFSSRSLFWLKKHIFPFIYWNIAPRGLWKGASMVKRT